MGYFAAVSSPKLAASLGRPSHSANSLPRRRGQLQAGRCGSAGSWRTGCPSGSEKDKKDKAALEPKQRLCHLRAAGTESQAKVPVQAESTRFLSAP